MQATIYPKQCFSKDSLLLNFTLNPLKFKPNGFKCGKSLDFCGQTYCCVNKYDFILISKHQKTNELMIFQLTIKGNQKGQVIDCWNYQEFSLGLSDQIRIFKDAKVGKLGWGSKFLSQFMTVKERGSQASHFFIKYDKHEKKWMGVWSKPWKNLNVKIQQIVSFLAKQRKLSFKQTEAVDYYRFEWILQSSNQEVQLQQQQTINQKQSPGKEQMKQEGQVQQQQITFISS